MRPALAWHLGNRCHPKERHSGADLAISSSVKRVLSDAAEERLRHARRVLSDARDALARFGAAPADQSTLAQSIRQLDELFLVIVVGEFNAGKSAFINALVGER